MSNKEELYIWTDTVFLLLVHFMHFMQEHIKWADIDLLRPIVIVYQVLRLCSVKWNVLVTYWVNTFHIITCKRLWVSFFFCCAVNVPRSSNKRSGCTDLKRKLCNKENRVAGMKLKSSASYQGGYDSSKDHTFTDPVLPQLWTSKPSTHKLTPISKHCRHPVTKQGTY